MAREFTRTQRVADQIQKDLAQLIQRQIKDPRVGMVTVSYVKVAKDLGYADVYVTVMAFGAQTDEEQTVKESLSVLNKAAGFLRHELARGIKLRVMPQLRFHFDESVDRGRRLHSLITQVNQPEPGSKPADDSADKADEE